MGKNSKISWTDHTFNPWWGCAKITAGCKNCYAEVLAARFGTQWGPTAERRFFGAKHWADPLKWNLAAKKAGVRARVFCSSMADVFEDRQDLEGPRRRLFDLIEITEHLDWLLVTKRPENLPKMLPAHWLRSPRSNVWLGATIEDRATRRARALALAEVPAAVHFWSCEPLLEQLDIRCPRCEGAGNDHRAGDGGGCSGKFPDWVIVGGESGPHARPCNIEWIRSIVGECWRSGVPPWVKQWGSRPTLTNLDDYPESLLMNGYEAHVQNDGRIALRDRAGADPSEWPQDLRVRELPKSVTRRCEDPQPRPEHPQSREPGDR